jgi:hypothetical protein
LAQLLLFHNFCSLLPNGKKLSHNIFRRFGVAELLGPEASISRHPFWELPTNPGFYGYRNVNDEGILKNQMPLPISEDTRVSFGFTSSLINLDAQWIKEFNEKSDTPLFSVH